MAYESLYFWVPLFVLIFASVYLVRGVYGYRVKGLENSVYLIYCSFAIAIALSATLTVLYGVGGAFAWVSIGGYAAYISLPGLFCLHVWTQVNYRKISLGRIIGYFIVPGFLTAWAVRNYVVGGVAFYIWDIQSILPLQYTDMLFIGYWLVMMGKSYLLCFNVFYQMPKHMKSSTGLLVAALSVMSVECVLALLADRREMLLLFLLALAFVLNRAFAGFFRSNASNVIATSREFVFSNLSTMILILSRKKRILEWNRSNENFVFKLLPPRYRQPFSDYRSKLLKAGRGVVSSHDENIITLTHDEREHHLLISLTPITEGDREFGHLVEIADITQIYSVLRLMESIAVYDQLTGLYNRNAYLSKASKALAADNLPLLIIIGDVNTLKLVNDKVGHIAGDRLLKEIACIVKEVAPPGAFVARIGGDEFAILVPNADERTGVEFAQRIRYRTALVDDEDFGRPDISLGWAVARSVTDDYNKVFKAADSMMYKEKKAFKKAAGISLSGALPEQREQEEVAAEAAPVTAVPVASPAPVEPPKPAEPVAAVEPPAPAEAPKPKSYTWTPPQ
jgi:diguanylate cyclase (GGDEF)-like protein